MSSAPRNPQGSLSTTTGPVEDDPKNHNQTELKKNLDKEQGMSLGASCAGLGVEPQDL